MIALLDTTQDLTQCELEIGCPVEQLLTPLSRSNLTRPDKCFAIDNGAFSSFNEKSFRSLLKREYTRRDLCRFVCVPDIVGSARRTLEVFDHWYTDHDLQGWRLALVAQDGQENLPIPWKDIAAIFIGGSTEWKLSQHAAAIIKTARALGKWSHAGRVNTPGRFEHFDSLGTDSIDGTGISRYSWMREKIWRAQHEPQLFDGIEMETIQ